jgi:hypothetical protein
VEIIGENWELHGFVYRSGLATAHPLGVGFRSGPRLASSGPTSSPSSGNMDLRDYPRGAARRSVTGGGEETTMRTKTMVAVAALLIGVWAMPARAQAVPPALTVTPLSGPVGSEFVVSGDQCLPTDPDAGPATGTWVVSTAGGEGLAAGGSSADDTGTWEDGFPSDPQTGPLPGPGYYVVEAACQDDSGAVLFSYQPVIITVTPTPGVLTVTPVSAPAGTTFTVSGDRCSFDAGFTPGSLGEWYVSPADGGDPYVGGEAVVDETGVWVGAFPTDTETEAVPDAAEPWRGSLPGPGSYVVRAFCVDGAGADLFAYEPVTITVTAPTPAPAPPPAAAPATARPAFTG